jgi:hypothetical protein
VTKNVIAFVDCAHVLAVTVRVIYSDLVTEAAPFLVMVDVYVIV